jgi:hypothetical protein
MSLMLFNHFKSNVLRRKIPKLNYLKRLEKTWNRVVLPVAYS